MNIYHLKYFIDAARLLSVSRSAKENFVSHSAVSQAIKSLEAHFEVSLVFHSKKRFQLTPEGELCLQEGEKLFSNIESLKEKLQLNRLEVRGNLILWAPQSLVVDSLYRTLEIYQKKYPQVQVTIKPGAAALARKAVQSGEVHVGLLLDDGHTNKFHSTLIKSGDFVLATKTKSKFELNAGIIVSSQEKIEVQHLMKSFKNKYKKDLTIKMEVMSWGIIKNLIEKGFGIGYVPDYCVSQELNSGRFTKINPPTTPFKYEIKAIWSHQKQLHPNAKLFIELLKQTS